MKPRDRALYLVRQTFNASINYLFCGGKKRNKVSVEGCLHEP